MRSDAEDICKNITKLERQLSPSFLMMEENAEEIARHPFSVISDWKVWGTALVGLCLLILPPVIVENHIWGVLGGVFLSLFPWTGTFYFFYRGYNAVELEARVLAARTRLQVELHAIRELLAVHRVAWVAFAMQFKNKRELRGSVQELRTLLNKRLAGLLRVNNF